MRSNFSDELFSGNEEFSGGEEDSTDCIPDSEGGSGHDIKKPR